MRQALLTLMAEVAAKDELLARHAREATFKQALIDKLTHEVANLRRLKYAVTSEKFCAGISAEQKSLIEETLDSDIAQLTAELEQADDDAQGARDKKTKQHPRREPLPAHLPRRDVHHEPENTACACGCAMKRIGQDIAERLQFQDVVEEVASAEQQRRAFFFAALILCLIAAIVPFASTPLRALPNISGIYGALTAVVNLATFWLLISAPYQPRSHAVIAAAYLFAGLMAVVYLLSFPGAVIPNEPVFGSRHAVSWLFVFWRAGFAMFIIWAALCEGKRGTHGHVQSAVIDQVVHRQNLPRHRSCGTFRCVLR